MIKKRKNSTLGLSYKHCQSELRNTTSWHTAGQAQDIASGLIPLMEALCLRRLSLNQRRAIIKEKSMAINRIWINN